MAQVQEDPFAKYQVLGETDTAPKASVFEEYDPLPESEDKEEESTWDKFKRYTTTSILPDLPKEKFVNQEATHPHVQAARYAEELGRSAYDELIKPLGSVLGAGITLAGGPIARGVLGGLSKIAPKLTGMAGNILGKEVFAGEAPSAVKKIVSELTPKGNIVKTAIEPKVSTEEVIPELDKVVEQIVKPKEEVVNPLDKFRLALEESKPLSREQQKLLSAERSAKFSKADKIDVTDIESSKKFMGQFKGEHTKLTREPLKLDQPDVNSLIGMIGENLKGGKISTTEGTRSIQAFNKLMQGSALQPNEIDILSRTFSPEVANLARSATARERILKTVSVPKALFSALDVGWPLRHGFNRVGQKSWREAIIPTLQAYVSEGKSKELVDILRSSRNFDYARTNGLDLYDGIKNVGDERSLASYVQELPGVKHGNRAYNVGISKARLDEFNTMFDDYNTLYKSSVDLANSNPSKVDKEELLKSAELLNPNNEYLGKIMADLVNTSYGSGNIGKLETISQELNAVVFSPKLISSRVRSINRVLNPMRYAQSDPIARKDALKQLFSMTGSIVVIGGLLKSAGAEVGLDPTSSDFGKVKIGGKTRLDLTGGYGSYFSAPAKIISGTTTSANTGKTSELNSGKFGSQTRFDIAEQFAINKEAPIASLATSWLRGVEPTGQPTNFNSRNPFENTAIKMVIPGIIQDLEELASEDPKLLGLLVPAALGASVAVHDDKRNKKSKIRSRR